MVYTKNI